MNDYLIGHCWTCSKFLIETLLEKIKPVVTEKSGIEYGDESKLSAYLDSSDNQNSEAIIKPIYYPNDYSCKSFNLSIETLLEEIKPVVIEENAIEYRQKPLKLKKRSILGSVRTLMQKKNDGNLNRLLLCNCKIADSDPHEGLAVPSPGEGHDNQWIAIFLAENLPFYIKNFRATPWRIFSENSNAK